MCDIRISEMLENSEFVFAKSMPYLPHWYTLKESWDDPRMFEAAVKYIRENGKKEKFGKRTFTYLYLNGFKYWTMGAPVNETILINRAKA